MKTDYVAAPFAGEFGWEVAMWVPWLRWMRKDRPHSTLTTICLRGHGELYRDFSDHVIETEIPGVYRADCQNAFMREVGRMTRQHYSNLMSSMVGWKVPKNRLYTPLDMTYVWPPLKAPRLLKAEHHCYETAPPEIGTIVIHARWHLAKQPSRNWPMSKWEKLLDKLQPKRIIAIGSEAHSMRPYAAEDLRGVGLGKVIDKISQGEFGIGPSSGPLHLMNACKRPVFWWSGNEKDVDRYGSAWNPHRLANVRCGTTWQPTVDEVATCIRSRSS